MIRDAAPTRVRPQRTCGRRGALGAVGLVRRCGDVMHNPCGEQPAVAETSEQCGPDARLSGTQVRHKLLVVWPVMLSSWEQPEATSSGRSGRFCVCSAAQSGPTLCDPADGSRPGSSARGVFQERILEQGATSRSRVPSRPGDRISGLSCTGRRILYHSRDLRCPEHTFISTKEWTAHASDIVDGSQNNYADSARGQQQ